MFKTIMVPLDGSPLAEHALPQAVELARKFGAELVLVRAFDPLSNASLVYGVGAAGPVAPYALEETTKARKDEAEKYLEGMVAALRSEEVSVTSRVLEGPIVEELASASHELPSALVVLTSRGRSGLKRVVLGSVTDALLRRVEVPVLVVPNRPDQNGRQTGPPERSNG
ncbi:MAG: universal stress protein [Dehalococcoidia bacterium]